MKVEIDGLVINEQPIAEKDKLVTILTSTMGVIRAFVRGAKNIRSSKCAATQLLCYSKFNIYQSKDKYIVDDAYTVEMFVKLRTNVINMGYAQYFCELAMRLCPTGQSSNDMLRLFLNGLYLLSTGKKDPLLVKACVEMRLLSMLGYMPDLVMCRHCGKYEDNSMYFIADSGNIICYKCLSDKRINSAEPLSVGVLRALRHTVYADFNKLFAFSLSQESLKELNSATEQYLLYHTEYDFKTLQFLKVIK